MLGESHSLLNDFPEHSDLISSLTAGDESFAYSAKQYDNLDREIRDLELKGAPIDDDAMHQLKHDRAELKDALYSRLLAATG